MKCEECRYFDYRFPDDEYGSCYRYPPVLNVMEALINRNNDNWPEPDNRLIMWTSPVVQHDHSCGEFESKMRD